ncbi:ABC transporter ATP-binding protein [Clostridium sp. AM58-1XD]|uniref:ABC transporter ATP-binding protein n=1 Tax=Clostridium sp. AM58-1XD TaxID=2292307 RepID=UPI0026C62CFC
MADDYIYDDYIYTENMTVGYGKVPLIRQIEIHVKRGEIVTLIGPNGAGKSTILRSVIRQLGLIGGAVYLDGTPMEHMQEKQIAKRMSVLMTERIHPELMTCEDVVSTGRYPYTGRMGILSEKDRKKVRDAMELVHAWELAQKDFGELSDGQRQRILLARAICQEPEAIILDEPTSFLDIRHKLELLTILKELVRTRKVAVLMSLHELDLAQKLSDYIVCVNGTSIERCGTPEEIFTSAYIKKLYGITQGSYHAELGCLEMEQVKGAPKVFVIGGNGSGIPIYRRLQRQGIPFAAGVLHENDIDYPIAKALAAEVVSEKPFEPIREDTYERAAEILKSCSQVICCLSDFGTMNEKNRRLAILGRNRNQNFCEKPK